MSESLLVSRSSGALRLTLNRPQRRNAFTESAARRLLEVLTSAATDASVRAILIDGAGQSFCAGADIIALDDPLQAATVGEVVKTMLGMRQPIVTAVHGPVAGAGCSLALAGDLCLADRESTFTLAFTRVGLMPDGGATALVTAALGRQRALRMGLLAEPLTAQEALAHGLVSEITDSLEDRAEQLVTQLASAATAALAETKAAINTAAFVDLDLSLARESEGQQRLLATADSAEGLAAFAEKRAPHYVGR